MNPRNISERSQITYREQVNNAKLNYHWSRQNWSLSRIFGDTFVFRVMEGGRLSRLFGRTYLHLFVLTLWDYLTQGTSHTIRFTLFIVSCLVCTVWLWAGPVRGSRFCQIQMYPAQEIAAHKQFVQKETRHHYALLVKQIFLMSTAPKLFLKYPTYFILNVNLGSMKQFWNANDLFS